MKKGKVAFFTAMLVCCMAGCGSPAAQTPAVSTTDAAAEARQSENTVSQEAKERETDFLQEAVYECEKGSIRLELPKKAVYTVEEYTAPDSGFGISFRLDNEMDGEVFVRYQENFGVCGTGLEETETTVNGMPARMGVYDQAPYWTFLVLTGEYTGYVITADGADSWWDDYGEQVMQVLETLTIQRKKNEMLLPRTGTK